MTFDEVVNLKWYPVVDDCIGGWAVSHVDKPVSEHDHDEDECSLADFVDEGMAKHIAELHNVWLEGQQQPRKKALDDMVAQAEELGLPY
jgi:hypothetical protein